MTIEDIIKQNILNAVNADGSGRRPDRVHASEVGQCVLKSALRLCGYAPIWDDSTLFKFFLGIKIHKIVQQLLNLQDAEKFFDNGQICGAIDGMLDGKLIEIKTAGKFAERDIQKQPYKSHIIQINAYFRITGIQQGIIVYFVKDTGAIYTHELSIDNKIQQDIDTRIDHIWLLKDAIEKEKTIKLSEVQYSHTFKDECNFCPYKQICPALNFKEVSHEKR
jgi:CRISPR/Cas system-associated exonuclease Cas4 (RecB family)